MPGQGRATGSSCGGGGGHSIAARQRARGDSLRAGGAAWSGKHPHPRLRHLFFLTHLKILPGSTTEYCQTKKA